MAVGNFDMEFLDLQGFNVQPKVLYFQYPQYNNNLFIESNILKTLVNEYGMRCIYLSLYTPFNNLSEMFGQNLINTNDVYIIDASQKPLSAQFQLPNYSSVNDVTNLTQVSIYITAAVNTGNFNTIIIDSLDILSYYNDSQSTYNFLMFVIQKFKSLGLGVIIIGSNQTQSLVNRLSSYIDKTINVKNH